MTEGTPPPDRDLYFSRDLIVPQSQEPGIVISRRDYGRLIERLGRCSPSGWAELWLAGVGAGVALAAAALVGALAFPPEVPAGTRDILWVLTGAGAAMGILCLLAYLDQRNGRDDKVAELMADMEMKSESGPAV